jgi:hypothetical protein
VGRGVILADVMDEVAARLDTIDGLRCHAYPADNVAPPAAVVTYPDSIDFDSTYARGMDRLTLPVVVLIGRVSDRASRDRISDYVDGTGAASLKAVLEADSEAGWMDLPGSAGSYASTPDRASLDVTGDIDLRVDVAADDWTPAAVASLVNHATSGNWGYNLGLRTNGRVRVTWSANGSTTIGVDSTVSPTVNDGDRLALRATLDVDNGASGRTLNFYTAPTLAGPWTPLGDPVTAAGVTSIFASTTPLEIGMRAASQEPFGGLVYGAEVRNGIDGTVIASPSFDQPAGTVGLLDDQGLAWSLHGTAAVVAGDPATYTSFDSLRVVSAEFDIVSVAAVEHLAATLTLDIVGPGS